MSDSIAIPARDGVSARMEMVAQNFRESGITVEVSERELRRVHDEMDAAIEAAVKVVETLRELAGPNPGPVPQHLITLIQIGTGYSRTARDTLRRLFCARNAARRERKKAKGKGVQT